MKRSNSGIELLKGHRHHPAAGAGQGWFPFYLTAFTKSFSGSNINHDTFKSVGPPLPERRRKPQEDRTMKSIIRKDEAAVSPVIATILMVAITVVLAAVLYVMVSGLITGPGGTPQAMGVGVQPSSDGSNWVVTGSRPHSSQCSSSSTLAIFHEDGSANLTATAFASLGAANGCSLSKVTTAGNGVEEGERVLCNTSWYVAGSQYQISVGTAVRESSNLQSRRPTYFPFP